jgi:hypothetical protein
MSATNKEKKSEPASTTNLVESASAGSKFRPASDAIQQNTRRLALRRISTINEIDDLEHIDCHHLIITIHIAIRRTKTNTFADNFRPSRTNVVEVASKPTTC